MLHSQPLCRRRPEVEREYFYAVHGASAATRAAYPARAYGLGCQF